MRWVCPGCGSQVSVALNVCPNCGASAESEPEPPAGSSSPAPVVPAEGNAPEHYARAPSPEKSSPARELAAAASPPVAKPPRQRLLSVPRPSGEAAERESAFWRGVKFGIGFMFAVAMILLLLALLLPWLRERGWQPWLDTGGP